jgi:glutathionyl-hydroquinone reductase
MIPVKLSCLAEVNEAGAFVRSSSKFTHRIGSELYPAAAGRYILFVSLACPWACRTLAVRALKGLEHAVPVVVVAPRWAATKPGQDEHMGWVFRSLAHPSDQDLSEVPPVDPVFQAGSIRAIYEAAAPEVQHSKVHDALRCLTLPLLPSPSSLCRCS